MVIRKIWNWLDGKKTIIGTGIIFIGGGLYAIHAINKQEFDAIAAIGGAVTTFGLAFKVQKLHDILVAFMSQ